MEQLYVKLSNFFIMLSFKVGVTFLCSPTLYGVFSAFLHRKYIPQMHGVSKGNFFHGDTC